jgi:CheY-like chemotaxis protein
MMVTAQTPMVTVEEALAAGADEYLMKPFTRELLVEKLAHLSLGLPRPSGGADSEAGVIGGFQWTGGSGPEKIEAKGSRSETSWQYHKYHNFSCVLEGILLRPSPLENAKPTSRKFHRNGQLIDGLAKIPIRAASHSFQLLWRLDYAHARRMRSHIRRALAAHRSR